MSASLNGSPVGGGASAPSGSGVVTASGGAFVSPVASAATTRATLGLGSLATASSITASQISDSTTAGRAVLTAADAAAQRTSLGLGGAAVLPVGTTAGTVAAGNDSRFVTSGLDLARAAAATAGASYLATDTGVVFSDTGSAWVQDANTGLSGWSGATGKLTSTVPTGGTASNPTLLAGGCTWIIRWYQGTVAGGTQRIFVTYTNGSRGWQIALSNPTANRIGIILFGINSTAAIENSASITVGWHCAAFSVASGGNTIIHSVDGAAATTSTPTGTYLPPVTADTFSIGAGRLSDVPLQSDCELYEMRAITTALDATQVAAITATPSVAKLPTLAGVTTDFLVRPSLITPDGTGTSWLSKGATPRVVLRTGTLTSALR
tara:strand:- start:63 stop:1199 length:1137 start_codon:yes stop_codon:yes gene_type:complete